MILTLQRVLHTVNGTYGVIYGSGDKYPICLTFELPWKSNRRDVSCIPPGIYDTKVRSSRKARGKTLELLSVPDRSGILFHIGNTAKDTKGCILVGSSFDFLPVKREDNLTVTESGVILSIEAMADLEACLRMHGYKEENSPGPALIVNGPPDYKYNVRFQLW